ncbi:MAG: 5-(carboxyamino)imidazole ribonucleotide synthase [Spirochaetaceae bacterium]|nr:MAG: 5-(carboxyamino)imidazole ribonucleotide synthase [Spirochaetaceae bacterium]
MSMQRIPYRTIGIVGGGQLGLMLCDVARRMALKTVVLDANPQAPALRRADETVIADLFDRAGLRELCDRSDIVTFEIEHTDTGALSDFASEGRAVIAPSPAVLERIRDKALQRKTLARHDVPQPRYVLWDEPSESPPDGMAFPFVQKLRTGGYDGRGVAVLQDPASSRLQGASIAEELVDLEVELAVIVARSGDPATGETRDMRSYAPVRMDFDSSLNICTRVVAPSGVSATVERRAIAIAEAAVAAFGIVGVCAVELFVAADGRILVNELAPRPHNSGHLTIEAHATSQFEQHLRAVCGLPLGSPELLRPAVMLNLLGGAHSGLPVCRGYHELHAIPETRLHWYDKSPCAPGRKMGHITCLGDTVEEAMKRADQAEGLFALDGSSD